MRFFLNNIFYSISYAFAKFLSVFFFQKDYGDSSVVIVKVDALGDYVIFRNFLDDLRCDFKKIILIGNKGYEDFSVTFDAERIDGFFWVDKRQFLKNIFYRAFLLARFKKIKCSCVVYPSYSREGYKVESIIKSISSNKKIAWYGDTVNQSVLSRDATKSIYTEIYESSDDFEFEFFRNIKFFSKFLGREIFRKKPDLLNEDFKIRRLPAAYALLFIGASTNKRKWSPIRFAELGKLIFDRYGLDIVICGGPEDLEASQIVVSGIGSNCINFVGKTTQVELVEIIQRSTLLVSNETAIPHIAVAVNHQNIFVIYNGAHFKRFVPYPKKIYDKYYLIAHPYIENNDFLYARSSNSHDFNISLNIDEVTAKAVLSSIELNSNI